MASIANSLAKAGYLKPLAGTLKPLIEEWMHGDEKKAEEQQLIDMVNSYPDDVLSQLYRPQPNAPIPYRPQPDYSNPVNPNQAKATTSKMLMDAFKQLSNMKYASPERRQSAADLLQMFTKNVMPEYKNERSVIGGKLLINPENGVIIQDYRDYFPETSRVGKRGDPVRVDRGTTIDVYGRDENGEVDYSKPIKVISKSKFAGGDNDDEDEFPDVSADESNLVEGINAIEALKANYGTISTDGRVKIDDGSQNGKEFTDNSSFTKYKDAKKSQYVNYAEGIIKKSGLQGVKDEVERLRRKGVDPDKAIDALLERNAESFGNNIEDVRRILKTYYKFYRL